MTVDEVLNDLQDRLLNAVDQLDQKAADHRDPEESRRLRAKAHGVMLALDYTRAYR